MIEVFFYSRFTAWGSSEIATKMRKEERTINWLKNNMIRNCLWCGKPILPPDDTLKCLWLIAQGRSQTDTAIILSKILPVKVSRSTVRTTIEKCKKLYGIDPYTLRDPKPICQKLIYDLDELLKEKRQIDP